MHPPSADQPTQRGSNSALPREDSNRRWACSRPWTQVSSFPTPLGIATPRFVFWATSLIFNASQFALAKTSADYRAHKRRHTAYPPICRSQLPSPSLRRGASMTCMNQPSSQARSPLSSVFRALQSFLRSPKSFSCQRADLPHPDLAHAVPC
ncbi:hypothetical protein VTG60DRAFT_1848 [Thermothelomyces hinnuleus]